MFKVNNRNTNTVQVFLLLTLSVLPTFFNVSIADFLNK